MNAFELRQAAMAALEGNNAGEYTYPARRAYPHQWNFASALSALGWAVINPERAYRELETLVGMAGEQGMLAHLAYEHGARGYRPGPSQWGRLLSSDSRRCSGITHPPVAAICLRLIFERYPLPERARPLLARLHAWHTFLLTERNYLGSNEPVLIHPWESAREHSPEWDKALARVSAGGEADEAARGKAKLALVAQGRAAHWQQFFLANSGGFRVLDPGFSALLAAACQDLAAVAQTLDDERMAAESELLAFNVAQALNSRAAADGLPRAYDTIAQQEVDHLSAGVALCTLLPSLRRATVLSLRQLLTEGSLACPFGVRSLSNNDPSCSELEAWRGAASPSTTWLCALGLERRGEASAAALLRSRLLASVDAGGLREHYAADSGQGAGAEQFSPTAALVLWELDRL